MRFIIRFFLSLCFLLVSGYGYLHAHIRMNDLYGTSVKIIVRSNQTSLVVPATSGRKKKGENIEIKAIENTIEEENEDKNREDKRACFEKLVHHFTIFTNTQAAAFFSSYSRNCLLFFRHFACSASPCFIVFRVIRI